MQHYLMTDLSPWRTAAELIDALFEARRNDRRDLWMSVEGLASHSEPQVREEAVSLLLVRWQCVAFRDKARDLLLNDPDSGVRARLAFGLATISTGPQRRMDARLLGDVFAANDSDAVLKCAAFEALRSMVGRPLIVELDDTDAKEVAAMIEEIGQQ